MAAVASCENTLLTKREGGTGITLTLGLDT